MRTKYTKEQMELVVKQADSIIGVIHLLGKKQTGGNYQHMRKLISHFQLDTSHFHSKIRTFPSRRKPACETLVLNELAEYRIGNKALRKALDEIGIEYKCLKCGLSPIWNGEPLTLEIDHINENPKDNRRENLQYLCPNCHTQKSHTNHSKRSRKSANLCPCGKEIGRRSTSCVGCRPKTSA